ncbi:MAG: ribbon-helix-helix protein, CopG family [Gammaproteobacteria bacterium]|nr:ribbon-helix-helix protein, CopG family [Gammaproteobacteria bacterium]
MRYAGQNAVTDRSSPTACVATSLPRGLYDRLNEAAERRGMSKGELVRELIVAYLAPRER